MTAQKLQLLGSTRTKRGLVPFKRCPSCGACWETLTLEGDSLARCDRCRQSFPLANFTDIKLKRDIAVCAGCSADVPLTPDYAGSVGYLCPECGNYVALHYGNRRVEPHTLLRVGWNRGLRARARKLTKNLWFAKCSSQKDYLVITALQVLAQGDDPSFRFVSRDEHMAGILIAKSNGASYGGFLLWTEDEHAILRQIFVASELRGQGHAAAALRFWVEHHADHLNDKFGIESPNEKSIGLLLKLGYARLENGATIGRKCFFVQGL